MHNIGLQRFNKIKISLIALCVSVMLCCSQDKNKLGLYSAKIYPTKTKHICKTDTLLCLADHYLDTRLLVHGYKSSTRALI